MRVARSKVFLICILCFVFGVGVFSFVNADFVFVYSAGVIGILLLIVFWRNIDFRKFAVWFLFFLAGGARIIFAHPDIKDSKHIAFYNGTDILFEGVVSQESDVRVDHQKLTISASCVDECSVEYQKDREVEENKKCSSFGCSPVSGRVLVKAPIYTKYKYGDYLRVSCKIETPEMIEDFSYDKYLARYDIYSVCWRGDIEKISSNKGNFVMREILSFKDYFIKTINQIISEPYSSFLAGLLVGARRGIPDYLLEAFNRTGTTHIIAISGTNITIIAAVIIGFLQFLGISKKRAFWWISAGIIVFVIITGATASVVRAGIMGIFVLLSRRLGRPSRTTNALALTAFAMILANPKIFAFDAGFQLSFLATIGLVYINPIIQNRLKNRHEFFGIKEAFVTTISAMIATTPLILYQFGRFSLVAPLANILIIPVIPLAMAFGFASAVVGMIYIPAGQIASWPAWLLLEYIIRVSKILSGLRIASFDFGEFHWILMMSMYLAILWIIWRLGSFSKIVK